MTVNGEIRHVARLPLGYEGTIPLGAIEVVGPAAKH
jgi:hypothetical protein